MSAANVCLYFNTNYYAKTVSLLHHWFIKTEIIDRHFFYFSNSGLDLYPTGPKSNPNLRLHASLLYLKIQQVWFIPNEVIDRKPSV